MLFSEFVDITQKASDVLGDIEDYELDEKENEEYLKEKSSYKKILKPEYG